jgi:hypothetical protein
LLVYEGKSLAETGRIVGMGRGMVRLWIKVSEVLMNEI